MVGLAVVSSGRESVDWVGEMPEEEAAAGRLRDWGSQAARVR